MGEASLSRWRRQGGTPFVRVAVVSDDLSNAASEHFRRAVAFSTDSGSAPGELVRASRADDFAYEDRRRGPSFPPLDAESFPRFVETIWETGAGQPRFELEILAVRGERYVAGMVRLDFGNGWLRECIHVMALDVTLRLVQRVVDFDLDDVDGAMAELDRMHSRADAS